MEHIITEDLALSLSDNLNLDYNKVYAWLNRDIKNKEAGFIANIEQKGDNLPIKELK